MKTIKNWPLLFTIFIIICAGFISFFVISKKIDNSQRSSLLKEANQASLLVPPSVIASLAANSSDLQNSTYGTLKQNLMSFRGYNHFVRFVYVLGYKPELKTQFFYVDSEPTTSSDYSPPGQLFADTRPEDIKNYLKGEPYTDGPYRDSWGEWVSAYAPIKNSDGSVVALLGIDTATSVWHQQINFVRTVVFLITVLICLVVFLITLFIRRKQISIESLKKENQNLSHKQSKLEEVQNMAQIGYFNILFPEGTISFDQKYSQIFSIKEDQSISKDQFLNLVHNDDHDKVIQAISEISSSDIAYTWFNARIGGAHSGFRLYHLYGNIKRDSSGSPLKFSGTIQDITDIHN